MKEFFSKYNLIYQELKNEVNHSFTSLPIFTRTKSRILEVKLKFIFHSLTIYSIDIQELYLKGKEVQRNVWTIYNNYVHQITWYFYYENDLDGKITQMKNIYKVFLSQSFAVYFLHEISKDGTLEHSRIS